MITGNTYIAGDLKISETGSIFVSGEVKLPDLAILEDKSVIPYRPVVFSLEDATANTIKITNTVIQNGTITPSGGVTVNSEDFSVTTNSQPLTINSVVDTEIASEDIVVVCQKKTAATPEWKEGDKILLSDTESVCYIYSKNQNSDDYDYASSQFAFIPKRSFVSPTQAANGRKFMLIVDPVYTPA